MQLSTMSIVSANSAKQPLADGLVSVFTIANVGIGAAHPHRTNAHAIRTVDTIVEISHRPQRTGEAPGEPGAQASAGLWADTNSIVESRDVALLQLQQENVAFVRECIC